MKKAGIILLPVLFFAFLVSCLDINGFNDNTTNNLDKIELDEDSFYAQNMKTGEYYIVSANMLYQGDNCVIWAEIGSGVTQEDAEEIADRYETIIRPRLVNTFSIRNFTGLGSNGSSFDNILDYANSLAGRNDGKLTILLLDIQDSYEPEVNDSYTAGYFFSGNFYAKGKIPDYSHYSNGRDMIYLDTYPGLLNQRERVYATLAHELQHLMNYVTAVQIDRKYATDTWIDEGLSSYAEYLYLEENPSDKCEWFSNDWLGTIAKGNNFFVWGNHKEEPYAILDDYATVYLFFRWLSLQAEFLQANDDFKSRLFHEIITSPHHNYQAVTTTAKQINSAWSNWQDLLMNWFAANYYPKNSVYGYKGDSYLQETIKVNPIAGSFISLYPGEGVYSIINNGSFAPASTGVGANINYAGIGSNTNTINQSSPYTGNILLTFNANTSTGASSERGRLTGVSPQPARFLGADSPAGKFTGPYVLDARDVLGDREKELPGIIRAAGTAE